MKVSKFSLKLSKSLNNENKKLRRSEKFRRKMARLFLNRRRICNIILFASLSLATGVGIYYHAPSRNMIISCSSLIVSKCKSIFSKTSPEENITIEPTKKSKNWVLLLVFIGMTSISIIKILMGNKNNREKVPEIIPLPWWTEFGFFVKTREGLGVIAVIVGTVTLRIGIATSFPLIVVGEGLIGVGWQLLTQTG